MGLIRWLLDLFGWGPPQQGTSGDVWPDSGRDSSHHAATATLAEPHSRTPRGPQIHPGPRLPRDRPHRRLRLARSTREPQPPRRSNSYVEAKGSPPYSYARYGSQTGHYLDLSLDADETRLARFQLPVMRTPDDLATWLGIPLNKVAWLVHRFSGGRPACVKEAHYHFHWLQKRRGGSRLIEAPKGMLKLVQSKILHEILDRVPAHSSAHGFAAGRSILTNAKPHVGKAVLVKLDLSNFYTTVSFARVVAIYRGLGYSREVAIWLGLLTTSAVPGNLGFQDQGPYALVPYLRRHLPQGAPTSPALANLSAFGLDARLSGLAKSYGATYTRYADDLTLSGPKELTHSLGPLIFLTEKIIRKERFYPNPSKRRILRAHQRQSVTGVIVNQKPNISRRDYDRLKAVLTNCWRHGPSTQNRDQIEDYAGYLRGCIAHVSMLNPARGQKLTELFLSIDWTK